MAEEQVDTEQIQDGEEKSGGTSVVRMIGLGLGIFVLMVISQIVTPLLLQQFAPGLLPGVPSADEAMVEEEAEDAKGPPQYLPLDPALVVSLDENGITRYLQVSVEVMARDAAAIEAVQRHMPVVRNNLLLLLGGRSIPELNSREGKEALRGDALGEVQQILVEQTGEPGVEEIYFTSFVIQ